MQEGRSSTFRSKYIHSQHRVLVTKKAAQTQSHVIPAPDTDSISTPPLVFPRMRRATVSSPSPTETATHDSAGVTGKGEARDMDVNPLVASTTPSCSSDPTDAIQPLR